MSSARIERGWFDLTMQVLNRVIMVALVVFLLAPAALIVVLSFSAEPNLIFPPKNWGLRQYEDLFASSYWLSSIGKSFATAIPAALIAALVGVPAVLAIERSRLPGKGILKVLGIAPLVLPGVAYAVALYTFYVKLDLIGNIWGVILADSTLALPFIILIVGAGLRTLPADLEMVAISLGASRLRATVGITLRLLLPSIAAATMLGFVIAFDEAVLINFLGGDSVITLPKAIYDSIREGLEPLITAVAVMLMVFTGLVMTAATQLRRR